MLAESVDFSEGENNTAYLAQVQVLWVFKTS